MCDIKMKRSVTNSVICRCLFAVGVYACSLILLDSVLGCAEAQEACPSKIHIVYDADVPPDDPAYQDVFTINGTLGQWSVADGELTLTRQADEDLIWIENNADFWKLADHGSGNKVTVRAMILPGSNWDIRLRDDGLDFSAMHIFDNAVYFEGNYNLGYSLDATVYHDYTVISGAGMVRYLIDNQVIHESVAPDGYINVIPYQSFFQIGAARDTALGTLFVDRLEIETHVLQTCPENEIFLPKPGSILPDQSALFQWTPSETAEAHRLDIGASIGAHDIFSQTLTGQTSVMVTGLPNADTWFYARLWTQTNGTWSTYKDYVYRTQLPHEFVLQADAQYLPEHAIKTFWTTGYCPGLWAVCSDAPEGQYCQHQEYQNTGCGWGIYYPEPQDLSVFEDGELIFYVRTTADLEITVSDPFLESHLNISDYGWINSGQWQLIRIPLADFGTDLSQVQYTFGIGYRYGSSAIEVDVDYVRWVRPYQASGLLPSFTIEPIANQDVSPGEELSLTFRPFESNQSPALSVLGLPEGAEFNLTHLTWTPASDKVWTHSLALIADDGSGDIMIKPFEIAVHDWGFVEGLHFEPLPPQSVYQGSLLSFTVVATDPHNEPLTYSAVQLPDGAVFDPATQIFMWTPSMADVGSHEVVFFVENLSGDSDTLTGLIEVTVAADDLAQIIFPEPDSHLATDQVTFSWSMQSYIDIYRLEVKDVTGTTLADVSTTASSTQVEIPLNGNGLTLNLWSQINGVWFSNEYQYTVEEAYPASDLILYDSFESLTDDMNNKAVGYHEVEAVPDYGPAGTVRYWYPGDADPGCLPGLVTSVSTGHLGRGLDFSYSGCQSNNSSEDVVVYPIGDGLDPNAGHVQLWFKPHYSADDGSALNTVIGGFKTRVDDPYNVYAERPSAAYMDFALHYQGWAGRKYWALAFNERNETGTAYNFNFLITSPGEDSPDHIWFDAEEWLKFDIYWNKDGIQGHDDKTIILMINDQVAGSTTEIFTPQHQFSKYMVIGGSMGSIYTAGTHLKSYGGASGSVDRLMVFRTDTKINYGDVNQDGHVSSPDASQAARYAVGLITLNVDRLVAADVNGDGNVTSVDASLIARWVVGLIDRFPVE